MSTSSASDPRLVQIAESVSDEDLPKLRRGGHDYRKVYAAYAAATAHRGAPSVILAKTVKGWTLGTGAEARNITHQMKKLSLEELKKFRDRLELPISDRKLADAGFYHPGADSPEVQYMMERRRALGGCVPKRIVQGQAPARSPRTRCSPSSRRARAPTRRCRPPWRSASCCGT